MHSTDLVAACLCVAQAVGFGINIQRAAVADDTSLPSPSAEDASSPSSLKKRQQEGGRCGRNFGDSSCSKDECCSAEGYCGSGYLYCSAPACQIRYGPACDANLKPQGPETEKTPRTHKGSVAYGKGIYHCQKTGAVALTFDDGPYVHTEYLLNLLHKYDAKATFFVTGINLGKGAINDPQYAWRGLVKRMFDEGHQVASHTWGHQRLTELSQSQLRKQMIYNEIAIADIIGKFPTYMRPPYSASNSATDSWLSELGYHITYFNLDTEGYLHDDPKEIEKSKKIWDENIEGKDPESIRFLHIEHDTVNQSVHNLTEYMLKSIVKNGLQTVTVGECLDDAPENWYRVPGGNSTLPGSSNGNDDTSPALPPTKDGRCGSSHGGQTCEIEPGATCCSQRGWCGNTTDHCGVGCQPIYGTCGQSK